MNKTRVLTTLLLLLAVLANPGLAQVEGVKEDVKLTLDFKDAPISTIMDYISESTGLVIISNYQLSGRISIISKKPVGIEEAISLINSVMKENGYAVVKTGNILKIVQLSEAKMMNIPVRSGSDPKVIEDSDELITHIIPILFADAVKLKDDLSGLLPEYAEFTANEASNSLIITDTSANVKRISKIVDALDTQMSKVAEIRVFHLVYADAENVSNLINELFEEDNSSDEQNPISRMFGRGGPPGFGGRGGRGNDDNNSSSSSGSSASRVVAADDEMTNAVVVSGPSETLTVIGNMIQELDSNPDEERGLYVYPLKNADSENIKELLNSLFSELEAINEDNTSGFGGGGMRGGNFGNNNSSSSSDSNDISDETYIESDSDTNSLIILTSNKNYDKIKAVIEELDKPIPQVLIKVLIAELTVTDDFDLGVELSYSDTEANGNSLTSSTNFLPSITGDGITTDILNDNLTAKLYALQQDGKLNVLSRPYILTSNNQQATINVGQSVPFITDSTYTETGQTVNTIEYDDIGIMLDVTPYINPEGLVIMDVAPEISTISDDTIQLTENVNATIFTKRSSSCKVAVRNGQTIVIGGLMQDTESEIVDKVPVLGDIPLLGLLFQRKVTSKDKTELLIFLTPQVAETTDVLSNISDQEQLKSKLLQEREEDSLLNDHIENMKQVVTPKQ